MIEIIPVAIRSLQCRDHAENIPPKVLTIHWFVGKRCNYDCSYCSPHVHDLVSPFIDIERARTFCDAVDSYCSRLGLQTKWAFTGGEPFVDPNFIDLSCYVRQKSTTYQMNVTTNGSLPLATYSKAQEYFDGITVSLHLERSENEIADILQKISMLKDCFVTVNLMFLPGRIAQVKTLVEQMKDLGLKFIVRKITPDPDSPYYLPYDVIGQKKKDHVLASLEDQASRKISWRISRDQSRAKTLTKYYSSEEEAYLSTANVEAPWHNCGVWYTDGSYREINSDHLVSMDQNQFTDWHCYAGVDMIYVDFDGLIYRGACQNDGSIGRLGDPDFTFQQSPTVCDKQWCTCNLDIAVRKSLPSSSRYVTK